MIRVVTLRPGSEPQLSPVQTLDDVSLLCAAQTLRRDYVRTMPEGYDLIALSNDEARTRPNVQLGDRVLFGTVVFALYDACRDAFIDPGRTAALAAMSEARVLPRAIG